VGRRAQQREEKRKTKLQMKPLRELRALGRLTPTDRPKGAPGDEPTGGRRSTRVVRAVPKRIATDEVTTLKKRDLTGATDRVT